jgi:hypothetical protein
MDFIEHVISRRVAGVLASPQVGFACMEAGSAFERYLDSALESFGIGADETERAVMAGVWSIWEPDMNLLRDADLDGVEHEMHPDLSAPPGG